GRRQSVLETVARTTRETGRPKQGTHRKASATREIARPLLATFVLVNSARSPCLSRSIMPNRAGHRRAPTSARACASFPKRGTTRTNPTHRVQLSRRDRRAWRSCVEAFRVLDPDSAFSYVR